MASLLFPLLIWMHAVATLQGVRHLVARVLHLGAKIWNPSDGTSDFSTGVLLPSGTQGWLHQFGGGRSAGTVLKVRDLISCRIECGSVEGLPGDADMHIERVLAVDEVVVDTEYRVVALVSLDVCVRVCCCQDLRVIAGQHSISHRRGTLAGVQEALRAHVCTVQCPPIKLLLSRPERVEWSKKHRFEFRYVSGNPTRLQGDRRGMVPVASSSQNDREIPMRAYAFREPIVPIQTGPLVGVRGKGDGSEAAKARSFPPRPLPLSEKMKIVRNWVCASSMYSLSEGPCAVCARNVALTKLSSVSLSDDCLALLAEYVPDVTRDYGEDSIGLDKVLLREALNVVEGTANVCVHCLVALRKQKLPVLAMANGLWLGAVPAELKALNFIEKMLVARYRHNMCVVTVRGGARQLRANAVVCSQPVAEFYRMLPPTPTELAGMLAIFCTGPCKLSEEELRTKKAPIFVRREVVLAALEWLKENHSDYGDLVISHENLAMYDERRPAVDWFYHPSDGKEPLESLAVYEGGIDLTECEGSCPFIVQGLCQEDALNMGYEARMTAVVEHLRKGGKVMGYGQSAKPESIYHNPRMYPGMFPWLFPYGLGGFENELMVVGVPRKTHVKYLLSYFDRRFQTDGYFIFLEYNQRQIRASSKGAYVLVERRNFENVVDKILSVNEDALRELVERFNSDGYTNPRNEEERKCFELLSLIDNVGGHVPGSNTRKRWQRSEIKSLIIRYGMPVFFITFAPSESASPVCMYLCGERVDLDSCVPLDKSQQERLDIAVQNPVACSRFFDLMVRLFVRHVLRADTNEEGLFGCTSAYYGTVEEQSRKTLHLHLLLWIAGSLPPEEIRTRIMNAEEVFIEEIIAWLDSCVQGQFSTGSLCDVTERMLRKGKHVKGGEYTADAWADPRLSLPESPPEDPDDEDTKRWFAQLCAVTDEILALVNVHDKRHPHGCQKPPDFQCRARFPRQLEPVTFADVSTGAITLKKGEAWVNTFNIVLTYLLRCNSDVTCLLSGTSVRAVIAYVTDYITKRSLKTGTMLETILAVYDGKADFTSSCATRADIARRLVTKVVNSFTSRLQAGGPSVCAELLGHPDHYTDKYFKVLYWRSYVRFVDRVFAGVESEEHDGVVNRSEPEPRDCLVLGREGGRILGYSRLDDYVYRPEEFGHVCLYDFLAGTDVVRCRKLEDGFEEEEEQVDVHNEDQVDDEEPRDSEGVYVPGRREPVYRFKEGHAKRDTHAVTRVTRPGGYVINFAGGLLPRKDVGDREAYCKTMLTLFCPGGWRSGVELREVDESWDAAFRRTQFAAEHLQVMRNMNLLYECQDARDDYSAQRRAAAQLDPLISFLSEAEMDELDVEHGDPLTGDGTDDLGGSRSTLDAPYEEGLLSASHRFQMEEMRDFIRSQYGESTDLVSAAKGNGENVLNGIEPRTGRQWRNVLVEERNRVVEHMRRAPVVTESDDVLATGSHLNYGKEGVVEALDEKAFLKKTGYALDNGSDVLHAKGEVGDTPTPVRCPGRSGCAVETVCDLYSLNREQARAFKVVVRSLTGETVEPLRMLLSGMGGTGKSRVIDALSYYLESRGESYRMLIVAPTGAAASLLGGSTYHSVLGLGRGNGYASGYGLGKVRDRLRAVDLVVLDEISMVSCHDFYTISERMSRAFGLPDEPFAGRHVMVAGDFTQLPPAGKWSQPLYSGTVQSVSSRMTYDGQKTALGKATWHGFTTVVILRENMRQRGLSIRDKAYREALERMRYGACTREDVALLDSRVLQNLLRRAGLQSAKLSRFRFVPVIVPLNTHRDAINEECCWRFAAERGEPLCDFYSVDRITSSRVGDTVSSMVRGSNEDRSHRFGGMTTAFREKLWGLPHGATEHVAGKLSLCVGMPVMLKFNEATELGVTNGAEGVVHGWVSRTLSDGKVALSTLFVRLVNPPRPIRLEGLPENVVPIAASIEKVKCRLPNDKYVSILREQVPVLPYFALTDFNAQGRTRKVNVVDLKYCRGAQSVYTCLSRSSSLDDTLILQLWTHKKVMNGIRADLKRELRELEILADITALRAEDRLPVGITGCNRSELVRTYQKVFGRRYVPRDVHPALRWDSWEDNELRPPPVAGQWYLVRGTKRGAGSIEGERTAKRSKQVDGVNVRHQSARNCARYTAKTVVSASLSGSHVAKFGQSGCKRLCFPSAQREVMFDSPYGQIPWDRDNWSCGYDCFVRMLQHVRVQSVTAWSALLRDNFVVREADRYIKETEGQVEDFGTGLRERVRDLLFQQNEGAFQRYGRVMSSVDQLARYLFGLAEVYAQHFKFCTRCGVVAGVSGISNPLWSTGFNLDMRTRQTAVGVSNLLGSIVKEHGQIPCVGCKHKSSMKYATRFSRYPELLLLEIPAEDPRFPRVNVDPCFSIALGDDGESRVWDLQSVLYLGFQHFTCRLITREEHCWFYDGMQNGGECVGESLRDIDLAQNEGHKACLLLYTLRAV